MTTQPAPPLVVQGPEKVVKIITVPLYGILATQKSFLLGLRSLSQQCYAQHLAHKIAGARLPAELCDEIGTQLSTLLAQGAERMWKRMKDDPDARSAKFLEHDTSGSAPTDSEKAFFDKFRRLTEIDVAEGQLKLVGEAVDIGVPGVEDQVQRYIHLATSLKNPIVSMLVPQEAVHSGGPSIALANRAITISYEPAGGSLPTFEFVRIRCKDAGDVGRLVQLNDVEASIRGWNQEIVEKFVEQFGLEVVTAHGEDGGGMKPQLRLSQRLIWR